jgi:hypothetical protein
VINVIIDVAYGDGWDAAARTVRGPISREFAAGRDAAGEPYAVVLREPGRGQPVAVLTVAWAHDYLGVWAYDEQGRRTRELDLRRLEPGRLFLRHMGQWRYDTADMAEFAGDAGRVLVDLYPDGGGWKISEPKGDRGGSRHTPADVPQERRWVPAPAFGDWAWAVAMVAVTAGRVSDVELRYAPQDGTRGAGPADGVGHGRADGPGSGPGEGPGWGPPVPLRPRHLDEMFTPGARFTPPDHATGPYVVERVVDAGPLRLPTGRIVACDPGWATPGEPFTVAVPPGGYPTQIATAGYPGEYEGEPPHIEWVTGARVLISAEPTVAWEPALRPGEDARMLREGEFYGFGVDSGMGCFVDAAAAGALAGANVAIPDDGRAGGVVVLDDPESGGNLIAYQSGWGDGCYPVWIGRDAGGEVTCLVADMLVLRHQELPPNRSR